HRQAAGLSPGRPPARTLRRSHRRLRYDQKMIFRVLFFVVVLLPLLVIIIPLQALINALGLPFWMVLPRLFHRLGCIFLGLRVTVIGRPATGRATLLVSNHVSWTDIVAVGSVADVTFVAKREVGE